MEPLNRSLENESSAKDFRFAFEKPRPRTSSYYKMFVPITTRWSDNDIYGHANNVVYYAWFDTAVNSYLIKQGALDLHKSSVIGLVVESHCSYFAPIAFPEPVLAGIRVVHIGNTSVRYEIGLFVANENSHDLTPSAANANACGHFVHVYVDKATRRPVELTEQLKRAVSKLVLL